MGNTKRHDHDNKGRALQSSEMQYGTHTLAVGMRIATIGELNGQLKKIGVLASGSSRSLVRKTILGRNNNVHQIHESCSLDTSEAEGDKNHFSKKRNWDIRLTS